MPRMLPEHVQTDRSRGGNSRRCSFGRSGAGRLGGRVADPAKHGILRGAEGAGKCAVGPVDQRRAGAKVGGQAQRFRTQLANAVPDHLQKQADFGVPESVDGLHRVADGEERPAIVRFPTRDQLPKQSKLSHGGILELVDQQMPNAVVQGKREVAGRILGAQRASGCEGQLREVDQPLFVEQPIQLEHRQAQHRCHVLQAAAGRVVDSGVRKASGHREQLLETARAKHIDQRDSPLLHLLCRAGAGWKPFPPRKPLPQLSCAGCQQRSDQAPTGRLVG